MRTAYQYGQPVTPAEIESVIKTLVPKRRRGVPATRIFAGLHTLLPNLVEHLVNRSRGIAFDSGEAGFSHTRTN